MNVNFFLKKFYLIYIIYLEIYEDPNNNDQFKKYAQKCMKNSAGLPVGI